MIAPTELKTLQITRLRTEFQDFVAQDVYRPTCDFFFGQIYSAQDTVARDAAFERFYHRIRRVLGGDVVRCLHMLLDLNKLTHELDVACLDQLNRLGAASPLDLTIYERAYAACDNYDARVRQIDDLLATLRLSHKVFHQFGIGVGLKALHQFETAMGEGLVTGILVEGYEAFRALPALEPLAQAVEMRERRRLDRIYGRL